MATSFVTRFRRHLATVPFGIVLLLPVGLLGVYIARDGSNREGDIAPIQVERSVQAVCIDPDSIASELQACPESEQGAE